MEPPSPTSTRPSINPQMLGLERSKAMALPWLVTVASNARMASFFICGFFWRMLSSAKMHGATIYPVLLEESRLCLAFIVKMMTHCSVTFGAMLYIRLRPECEKEFWDATPSNRTISEETPPVTPTQAEASVSDAHAQDHESLASTFDWENDRTETHTVQVVNCEPDTVVVGGVHTVTISTKRQLGRERVRALREKRRKSGLRIVNKEDRQD